MSDFLPDDYKMPVSGGNYMKLQAGKNKFRILDKPIFGMEFWIEKDGKRHPERRTMDQKIDPKELPFDVKTNKKVVPKHFWCFPVWNYTTEQIELLEITQKTLMQSITELSQNEDWGSVYGYDMNVNKAGEGLETTYTLTPSPKKPLDPGMKQLYKDMHINLEAMFTGDDPFSSKSTSEKVAEDVDRGMSADEFEEVFMTEQKAMAEDVS